MMTDVKCVVVGDGAVGKTCMYVELRARAPCVYVPGC